MPYPDISAVHPRLPMSVLCQKPNTVLRVLALLTALMCSSLAQDPTLSSPQMLSRVLWVTQLA